MSHIFQVPDDLYARLEAYAAQKEQTPETLFLAWISELTRNTSGSETSKHEYEEKISQEFQEEPEFEILVFGTHYARTNN